MILGIDHVGIAVRDASAAALVFADLLARIGTHVEEVAGQAVHAAFVPEAWPDGSGARVEILSPADGNDSSGAVARFLDKRGEGLHHICFVTDDIEGEIKRLSSRYTIVDSAPRRGHRGRVAFLHPRGAHGVLVELIQRDVAPGEPSHAAGPIVDSGVEPARTPSDDGAAVLATRLLDEVRAGDRRALARALTMVEAGGEAGRAVVAVAWAAREPATVIGFTGAPGAGKSTLVGAFAKTWRDADPQSAVAVLAIDPSSPTTGGAVLGDRVRMGALAGDRGVFVRSVAGRGAGDGLADASWDMLTVLRAARFGVILLETVGGGQDALAVASLADVVVVVHAPGLGDSIQGLKSGVNDLADVIVVNKADLDGAPAMASGLRFGRGDSDGCSVVETIAITGVGVAELRAAVIAATNRPGDLDARARRAISRAAMAIVRMRVGAIFGSPKGGCDIVRAVVGGEMSPSEAADIILKDGASHRFSR
jgi:LAO/AO transport system kinase